MGQLYYLPTASRAGFVVPRTANSFSIGCFFDAEEKTLQFASKLKSGHPSITEPLNLKLLCPSHLIVYTVLPTANELTIQDVRIFQYLFDLEHNLKCAALFCPNVASTGRICFPYAMNFKQSPRSITNLFWSGLFTESMVDTFPDLSCNFSSPEIFFNEYLRRFQKSEAPAPIFSSRTPAFNAGTVSWIGSVDALYFDPDAQTLIPAENIDGRWLSDKKPLPETLVPV